LSPYSYSYSYCYYYYYYYDYADDDDDNYNNNTLNFSGVSSGTLRPFWGFLCYVLGAKLDGVLLADASQSHAACAGQARWPQDVANMRKKLKSLNFSPVSEGTFWGSFATFWGRN